MPADVLLRFSLDPAVPEDVAHVSLRSHMHFGVYLFFAASLINCGAKTAQL